MVYRLVRIAAAALALCLLSAPAGAQVPDPFARQLAGRLEHAERQFRESGFTKLAGPIAGALGEGGAARFPFTLRAGRPYVVVGVCEQRCADLDLSLADPGQQVVSQDAIGDAAPFLGIVPARTETFTLTVVMTRCAAPACYFAFTVHGK
jgi:hypothetical protein